MIQAVQSRIFPFTENSIWWRSVPFSGSPCHLAPAPAMYGIHLVIVRRRSIAVDIRHGASTLAYNGRSHVLAKLSERCG